MTQQTGQRILVIDDDRFVREMLRLVLQRAGYQVISAEDGPQGVEKAENEKPDLVVVDGMLPKLHGFLVCKAIKESAHHPRVIVFTGVYTKPSQISEVSRDCGADEIIKKGARATELLDAIRRLLPEPQASTTVDSASAEASPDANTPAQLPALPGEPDVNCIVLAS